MYCVELKVDRDLVLCRFHLAFLMYRVELKESSFLGNSELHFGQFLMYRVELKVKSYCLRYGMLPMRS